MWKKSAAASLTAAVCLSLPCLALDLGDTVNFGGGARVPLGKSLGPSVPGKVIYETPESDPIPRPWNTVLFHGICSEPAPTFEVSRRAEGIWSAWVKADLRRFPDGRFWAKAPMQLGPGPLRIRAVGQGQSFERLEIFGVEVFIAGTEPPAGPGKKLSRPARRRAVRPRIYLRSEWGARAPSGAYEPHVPWRITLHHTAGIQTRAEEDTFREARFIQDFHQFGRGWKDIGYHFLIDSEGRILQGRPQDAIGAHVEDDNLGNIGIALLGTYHAPKNDAVSPAQLKAILDLARYLLDINRRIEPANLLGHRDYLATDCPGDKAYPLLKNIREKLKSSGKRGGAWRQQALPGLAAPPKAWN
ncbi:MAG: N-acetylmuramoyl-L-alanine amidase [Elusimicrobia bacterium]|nr:N-acetylmuramoyl-L-alanine amidase [Elusimicrobiota bacterium]